MIVMLITRNDLLTRVETIEANLPVSTQNIMVFHLHIIFYQPPQHLLSYIYAQYTYIILCTISICVYKTFPRYKVIRMNEQKHVIIAYPKQISYPDLQLASKCSLTGSSLVVRLTSAWCGVGGQV